MRSIAGDLIQQRLSSARLREPALALNRQLYACLQQAILDASLPAASRMPPTRDLADELELSRNTVMYAYGQLLAEGYLRAVVGSGTFVTDSVPDRPVSARSAASVVSPAPGEVGQPSRLSARGRRAVEDTHASPLQWGAFMPGVPDVTQAPHHRLAKIATRLRREMSPEALSYAPPGGHAALQRSVASYLRQARSVVCEPEQVVITEGVHQAIDLIARLLGDPGQTAWVEEPGYWGIGRVLAINGIKTQAVPVDAEGMNPALAARGAAPRFAFVTPSHQYPLGAIMSMGRRLALIELSIKAGTWIVEDDYDSEFRFSGHPVAALQGLALRAQVIYIGTFSKTLYPGMRTAYMVLPADLAKAFRTAHSELYRGGHVIAQAALAEYIDSGDYAAHIRKMRLVYASRRAFLIRLIEQWLGPDRVHGFDTNAGLHVVLSLPDGVDDVAIAQAAQERGVLTRALSRYYAGGVAKRGLLLGFACVPEADMLEPFKVLVACIRQALPAKAKPARRRKAAV